MTMLALIDYQTNHNLNNHYSQLLNHHRLGRVSSAFNVNAVTIIILVVYAVSFRFLVYVSTPQGLYLTHPLLHHVVVALSYD